MKELELLRKEIDDIDEQLVRLFEKRMELAVKIGAIKKKMDMAVLDSRREEEVIEKAIDRLKDKKLSEELELFFRNIMDLSKKIQYDRMQKAED
ncbi:chorismate mutase [Lutispora thermophila]|uniref:Chorismate mutase n=1 Tax=Lutispora thermophila DSM 19022 TaxID=1122184 RepID=A0A1M6DQM7_9FIRM|nr:chorismate mutase [Lutispora thermophila]SHI75546.1 chorismate mutase [Lutispora thermophila DSM 19022]